MASFEVAPVIQAQSNGISPAPPVLVEDIRNGRFQRFERAT
jgi:hypothetical protein